MGLGGESEGEWRERASEAVSERLKHQAVHLGETARTLRRELDATEAALWQTQDELARERTLADAASKLTLAALMPAKETEAEETENLRKMAAFYNHYAPQFSEMQTNAITLAFDHAGVAVLELSDGDYALPERDLETLGEDRVMDADRQGMDRMLAGLHQAERSRQNAADARQDMADRKTRAQERDQDSGSDWG